MLRIPSLFSVLNITTAILSCCFPMDCSPQLAVRVDGVLSLSSLSSLVVLASHSIRTTDCSSCFTSICK
jgi:hypothetical protein